MNTRRINALLLCFFPLVLFINLPLSAQNCNCTLDQVLQNTVNPCTKTIGSVVNVTTTTELKNAINQANSSGGNSTILIADGSYQIASTSWYPYITASNLVIRSQSGNRDNVILYGSGNASVSPDTEIGIYAVGDHITIADLTIREVGNHGIAVTGDSLFVHNVKIQDTYEQMIKGNSAGDGADDGIVQCSYFEYTSGIGPNWYIGGLDIHEGDNWIVRDNFFQDIASPHTSLAEHAIHFWDNSSNNMIERNRILNCDRGIGFGLGSSANVGGTIRNNMIYNDGQDTYDDVGIGLETSPNTRVYHNTILIEYQNAIEYRFTSTNNVTIENNLTNKAITSRNGAQANVGINATNALASWFTDVTQGDLHIGSAITAVVDQGTDLTGFVGDDIDQELRPIGAGYDIGADEYISPLGVVLGETIEMRIFPQPTTGLFNIEVPGIEIPLTFQLQDGRGVEVMAGRYGDAGKQLDITSLKPGMYFLTVRTEAKTYQKKVVRVD